MADVLPPAPVDAPFGSYNWADWYKKVRDAINNATSIAWGIITDTPTTMAGYGVTKVDIPGDVIVDTATNGLVLKDTQATPHYWRITISNVGVLVITDLGTSKP